MKKLTIIAFWLMTTMTVTAQNTVNCGKMSPWLATQTAQTATADGSRRSLQAEQITLLAKLTPDADEQALAEKYHFEMMSRIGEVLVLRMPLAEVAKMAEDDQVARLEAERAPRPMLDLVPKQISADKVWKDPANQLPQAYTGKGVVVGIVDSGFDYINPFFDADPAARTEGGADAANPRVVWASDYMNGRTYTTKEQILSAMHSSDASKMYHGTHVAGIAAGSRFADNDWDETTSKTYQGIASEADIAMGAIDSEITSTGLSSATSVQAFNDIFSFAQQQGKPCVINYSLGDAMSFVNNRQLEEEAIRTLLQQPGRALVVAAGNAGGTNRLATKNADFNEGGCGVRFNDWEGYGTYFGIEVKVKQGQSIRLRYTDTGYSLNKGELTMTVEQLMTTGAAGQSYSLGTKRLTVMPKGDAGNGYVAFYITAGINTTFQTSERILVTIQGEGDAWIYADPLCAGLENVATIANHSLAEEGYSMAWPACMPEVVTVGNIGHRFQILTQANKYGSQGGVVTPTDISEFESTKGEGYLAKSSSVGPTLAGNVKPDVCAPGVNIVSAQNFFIDDDTYYSVAAWDISALDTEYEVWGGLAGYFHMMAQTGTSMSAPAVAGTIALWMQAEPTLTTDDVKDIIANSSRQPDAELTYPNNQYGYGEIDAYRGLLYMFGLTGIEEISDHQPQGVQFVLEGRQFSVRYVAMPLQQAPPTLRIYSTDGRLLMEIRGTTANLSALPQGVYAVQLNTGQKATTGSTLIRIKN